MLRYIAFLLVLVVGFAVWFAPASLLRRVVNDIPGVDIVSPAGSLWNGQGTVLVNGEPLGTARWTIRPSRLAVLEMAYAVEFSGRDSILQGELVARPGSIGGSATGTIGAQSTNQALSVYEVTVPGDIHVEHLSASWSGGRLQQLDGGLAWAGGVIAYATNAGTTTARLPAINAVLSGQDGNLNALLVPLEGQTPLLQASLAADGQLRVGITRLLTRLAGMAWQGSEPDHAIVIEMTDDLF